MFDVAILGGPIERHGRMRIQIVELGNGGPSGPQVRSVVRNGASVMGKRRAA